MTRDYRLADELRKPKISSIPGFQPLKWGTSGLVLSYEQACAAHDLEDRLLEVFSLGKCAAREAGRSPGIVRRALRLAVAERLPATAFTGYLASELALDMAGMSFRMSASKVFMGGSIPWGKVLFSYQQQGNEPGAHAKDLIRFTIDADEGFVYGECRPDCMARGQGNFTAIPEAVAALYQDAQSLGTIVCKQFEEGSAIL